MKNFLSIVLLIALVFPLHAQLKCISGNCSNGYGTCVFSNGAKYVGDFKNGKLHGKGIFYYTDGNQYIGNWVNQLREGKGRMIFSNGDEYFGIFRSNKMEGNGKMTYANGNVYEGMWQSDRPSGQGVLLFADGARYDGEFGNGVFDGYGVFRYIDQSRYEGNWRNGKQHGIGTLYTYDNQSVSGNWISGVFESDQLQWKSLETIDTSSLRNCNLNFCAEGKGKYRYADGTLFIGDFNNGRPAGEGTILFLDGKRYKGQWTAGQPNGRGVMYYKDGRVVGALWQNGNAVQQLFVESGHPLGTPVSVDYNEEVKIWAVVVGAASYTYMPSLRYTDDDAYQVYAFLKSPEGGALPDHQIQVLIDENATREGILEAMRTTFLKADNNDVLLFYFSGHGLKGAFLPIDYDGQDNQLYHEQIKEILQLSKAKHKLILADACHSGS
ncbi:MAG: caspase family protein, partial [Bacteroidota bacterium]